MKKLVVFIFMLSLGVSFGQETPKTTPRTIEPVPETKSGGSMLFPEKKESKTYTRPKENNEIKMRMETDLVDPGIKYKNQKFKKDAPVGAGFRSDTFLGEIRTGEKILRLVCRDHQFEDGDMVRIWQDDKILVDKIYLRNAYQGVAIPLKDGFNKLEIEALNQGTSGPNTAEFKVMDMKGKVVQQNIWNLASGVRATLIILKNDK
ncbi:hypothetical protein LX97_03122 [Nonlabens dokdonensis]|jgi:hypothetical protein|uniref:Secreted protein n=2 Tax=Nonlabens dokdonensis TaxID=328515 RepID=L7WGH1_NONDD|nr:hypothetical protein [Nonlabens dokdonensis]AGC78033.1 secreted protein [Nonlabens dokdonensis DSW-6]PZX37100.1 hypothetical protein LX97_03122 [Nonlabens dokdonensis]